MSNKELIPSESVVSKIYLIRGHKVMLDMDLAELYGVETKQFKRAVKRNLIRFPEDFMFELSKQEMADLGRQIGTSKIGSGGVRYAPMVFTEQGVAMLSSVLNTQRAILTNIQIIRVFSRARDLVGTNKDLLSKLDQIEQKMASHDEDTKRIFNCIKELLSPSKPIGFQYNKN